MSQNEDIDYTVSEFATPETKHKDPDQPNKSVLRDASKYLGACMKAHNTFDAIDLNGKMSAEQQIAVHKHVVAHLRDIKSDIDSKLRELV